MVDYADISIWTHNLTLEIGVRLSKKKDINPIKNELIMPFKINDKIGELKFSNKYFIADHYIKYEILKFCELHSISKQKGLVYKITDPNLDVADLISIPQLYNIMSPIHQYITNGKGEDVTISNIKIILKNGISDIDMKANLQSLGYTLLGSFNKILILNYGISKLGLLIGLNKLTIVQGIKNIYLEIDNEYQEYIPELTLT